jgi:hypothetical protein
MDILRDLHDLLGEAKQPVKVARDAFLYLDPKTPNDRFAQCGSCLMFTGKTCTIHGPKVKITEGMSCGLYVHGKPMPDELGHEMTSVTPEESGLTQPAREVRCKHCRFFDGKTTCGLFVSINEALPKAFDLDETVDPQGCCNANAP